MIAYTCSRGHEIDVCAECAREQRNRLAWDAWEQQWAAAPDAEFALGSTGTIHRRGSCVRWPGDTTLNPVFRATHSPPMTQPLAEPDAAILLLSKRGRPCGLCMPNVTMRQQSCKVADLP